MGSTQTAYLDGILKKAGMRRQVQLVVSTETLVPMAVGLHRPCIIFPANLVQQLQQGELDQIALHEAGHLMRYDDYGLLLQRVIQALFVFHPLVHWICRQLDIEREIACDDFVLDSAQERLPYASCLTRVAELCGGVDGVLGGAPAVSSRSALVQRIELLLDETRSRSTGLMKIRLALIVAGLITAGGISVRLPRAVVFAAETVVAPASEAVAPPPASVTKPAPTPLSPASIVSRTGVARQTTVAPVRIQVIVRDSLGRYVSGLEKEHFRILEDGQEQEITQFSVAGPVSLYVVLNIRDGAGSELLGEAGRGVLSDLGPDDEFAVAEVRGSRDAQPASLVDGIERGLNTLRSARNQLKAVVVISDWDGLMYPQDATEKLREALRASDAPVYVLSPAPTNPLLDDVDATGGYHAVITTPDEVKKEATRILVAVRNSYTLEFRPARGPDGAFRRIGVQIVPPRGIRNLSAKIRTGYYAR
jgi:hypothetical protein